MTPENAQVLYDFRVQMSKNRREGKPLHEGFTEEKIRTMLEILRQGRTNAGKSAGKTIKAKKPILEAPASLKEFCDLDLG